MSASDLSAAVGMRNRLFLLYPKWPGPEPGLLQRSSGAQVRWVPCGARTPANFETSRISCVVVLSIMGLLYRPSNVVSKVGSHVGLFFFFFLGPSGSIGGSASSLSSSLFFWEISGWESLDLTRFPWTVYVGSEEESPVPLLPVTRIPPLRVVFALLSQSV